MNREDEEILRFRYQKMDWKVWALIVAANLALYFVVSVLQSSG